MKTVKNFQWEWWFSNHHFLWENIILIKNLMHLASDSSGKGKKTEAKMPIWCLFKEYFFFSFCFFFPYVKLERILFVWERVVLSFVFVVGCFQSHIKNEIKIMFSGHHYWLTSVCILFILWFYILSFIANIDTSITVEYKLNENLWSIVHSLFIA